MLPELSPTFAALARIRAAPQPGGPGQAAPPEPEGGSGSFADEVSGPNAVTREDGTDRPEREAADAAGEDRAESDELPLSDKSAQAEATAAPQPAAVSSPPGDAVLTAAALGAGMLPAGPALPPGSAGALGDPLAAGPAGTSSSAARTVWSTPPSGALALAAAASEQSEPGDASTLSAADPADSVATTGPVAEPDGTGPKPATDPARPPAGSLGAAGQAGFPASLTTDRTAPDTAPAPAPPLTAPAGTAAGATMTDPRAVLAAQAAAAESGDTGTGTDGGTLSDRTGGEPGAIAHVPATERGGPATLDAPRSAEPRGTVAQTIGSQIVDGIRQARDGSIEIALSPEELGSLKLTLAGDDSRLHVHIHAERPDTEGLLRRHIALLQQDFRDLGYGHVSFDFGTRQDRPERFEPPSADAGGPDDGIDPVTAAAPTPRLAALPAVSGRALDLRL